MTKLLLINTEWMFRNIESMLIIPICKEKWFWTPRSEIFPKSISFCLCKVNECKKKHKLGAITWATEVICVSGKARTTLQFELKFVDVFRYNHMENSEKNSLESFELDFPDYGSFLVVKVLLSPYLNYLNIQTIIAAIMLYLFDQF